MTPDLSIGKSLRICVLSLDRISRYLYIVSVRERTTRYLRMVFWARVMAFRDYLHEFDKIRLHGTRR
jgi:hypothetical protein